MYQCGPYGPNHATAGTFAFKAQLLKETKYDDGAALAEEKSFLKFIFKKRIKKVKKKIKIIRRFIYLNRKHNFLKVTLLEENY